MIIKFTLVGLVLLLIAVIATSYYVNKEGFDNITSSATNTPSVMTPSVMTPSVMTPSVMTPSVTSSSIPAPVPAESTMASSLDKLPGTATSESTPALAKVLSQTIETPNSAIPQRNDVVSDVALSKSSYDSMNLQQKTDLLRDIQKIVKNEILASRSTEPVGLVGKSDKLTNSTAQGKEYEESCYKDTEYRCPKNPDGSCPPLPDMTQYIKKDEIPCWGCSLDY